MDAYFFLRFLRMGVRVFLPIWLLSWLVLLPVDSVGTQVGAASGLDRLTFGNVSPDKQSRYYAHLVLVYLFTGA
jgi:calcium permeable stress-gated cation channel